VMIRGVVMKIVLGSTRSIGPLARGLSPLRKPRYDIRVIEEPADSSMRETMEMVQQAKRATRNHRKKQNYNKKKAKKQEQQRTLQAGIRDQYIQLEHFQDGMWKLTPKRW